ncbi:uncharacterized protein LJ206_007162 isoform 3-T4 [Theristicus caerulescens]
MFPVSRGPHPEFFEALLQAYRWLTPESHLVIPSCTFSIYKIRGRMYTMVLLRQHRLSETKKTSFFLLYTMERSSHEFSAMSPYGNNFIVRRRLPFYHEKRLHGNHGKLQKKVSVIV